MDEPENMFQGQNWFRKKLESSRNMNDNLKLADINLTEYKYIILWCKTEEGNRAECKTETWRSILLPSMITIDVAALVESGHGLIRRSDLNLHEVRLPIGAIWACHCKNPSSQHTHVTLKSLYPCR